MSRILLCLVLMIGLGACTPVWLLEASNASRVTQAAQVCGLVGKVYAVGAHEFDFAHDYAEQVQDLSADEDCMKKQLGL